jgi:large subunit ribosomal protein L21
MYAVIKAGGKQHRVKPGDVIEVELMHAGQGDAITFHPLLVVDDNGKTHVGKELGRATVKAKLVGEEKGDKVKIFKYRPKTGYAKRQGHRQMYTLVEIQDVNLGRTSKKAGEPAAEEAPTPEDVGATDTAEATGAAAEAPVVEHPATAEAAETAPDEEVESATAEAGPSEDATAEAGPAKRPKA